ncbi:hypothetical protein [Kitasatospora sp. NPDC058190]|uniref:DUF6841 family protein n=1 Tax=Kitasatospora sp. NPDC058190 TaxID=3346371 RepID=UPI0036DCED39
MSTADLSRAETDAKQLFDRYAATFIELAAAGGSDPAPLLEYFAVPLTVTTGSAHTVLTSAEQLTAGLAHELAALRDLDYGGSQALDPAVRELNERAVTIEVSWARYDRSGAEFQRPRVFYFLARTPDGWRITTSAVLAG